MGPQLEPYRDQGCTACPLHETCKSVCIPMRGYSVTGKDRALLVVGQSPGRNEDLQDSCFVGEAGRYLQDIYINPGGKKCEGLWAFGEVADVYFTNAVRCCPPENADPNKTQMKACRQYLERDLKDLQASYKNLTVLAVGTHATQALLGLKVEKAFHNQGAWAHVVDAAPVRVFSTYHPAMLQVRRDPSKLDAIGDHLYLVWQYLRDARVWALPQDFPDPHFAERSTGVADVTILSLDIETYGAVKGLPAQNHFHPLKSETHDKVDRDDLIQTVGLAWRNPDGLGSSTYNTCRPEDKMRLWKWIQRAKVERIPVVGMNIGFDLIYLRHVFPWSKSLLNHKLFVIDLGVLNFLHSEVRPEKSLKDLSRLFGITPYDLTLKEWRADSKDDPRLLRYCAEDCLAGILLYELLIKRIREDYHGGEIKLSEYALQWYSDLVWTSVYMKEAGVAMDVPRLTALHKVEAAHVERISAEYQARFEAPLMGKGSGLHADKLAFDTAVMLGLQESPVLARTLKLHKIKLDKQNIHFFKNELREDHLPSAALKQQLILLEEFRGHRKLVSSYLEPLLLGKGKGKYKDASMPIKGIVYPDWYIVPGIIRDEEDLRGGTIQCRVTPQRPALQTSPTVIKEAITTRFDPGYLYVIDLSQIELRVAGWLSNDPMFREVYEADGDLHTVTAVTLFGDSCTRGTEAEVDKWRQAGKKTNFLMLYLGGAQKLHDNLLNEVGLDIPVYECENMIRRFYEKYKGFARWQQELIAEACRVGYIHVPLVGASRLFLGSEQTVIRTYKNVIVNLLVQAIAANLLISGQTHLIREFQTRKLRSLSGLQIYDSLFVEGPIHELPVVRDTARRLVVDPPYYRDLCKHLGRDFPIKADEKVWIHRKGELTECG